MTTYIIGRSYNKHGVSDYYMGKDDEFVAYNHGRQSGIVFSNRSRSLTMAKSAYRSGYVDGLLGRKSENPYTYLKAISMAAYNKGYLTGIEYRRNHHITITIKREISCKH